MCSAYARSASMPNLALVSSSCDTLTRHEPKATRSGFPGFRVGTTDGGKSANSGSSGGQTGCVVDEHAVRRRRARRQSGHLDQGVVVVVGAEGTSGGRHVAGLDDDRRRFGGLDPDGGRGVVDEPQQGSEPQRTLGEVTHGEHLRVTSWPPPTSSSTCPTGRRGRPGSRSTTRPRPRRGCGSPRRARAWRASRSARPSTARCASAGSTGSAGASTTCRSCRGTAPAARAAPGRR